MTDTNRPSAFYNFGPSVKNNKEYRAGDMRYVNGAWHLAPEKPKESYKGKAAVLALNMMAFALLTPPAAATVTACSVGWYSLRNLGKPKNGKTRSLPRRFFANPLVAGAVTLATFGFFTHVNHVNWTKNNTPDLNAPEAASLSKIALTSAIKGGENSFVIQEETPSGKPKTYNMTVNPQRLNAAGKPDAKGNWYRASAAFTPTDLAFRFGENNLMVKDYLMPISFELPEAAVTNGVDPIQEIKADKRKRVVPTKGIKGKNFT